ncbi:hypothetical protein PTKIN_Ptkin09bG0072400 [Pterospermum kingtungense]
MGCMASQLCMDLVLSNSAATSYPTPNLLMLNRIDIPIGLKSCLSREVRLAKPNTLLDAFDLAKEYEARSEDSREDRVSFLITFTCQALPVANTANMRTLSVVKKSEPTTNLGGTTLTKLAATTKPWPFKKFLLLIGPEDDDVSLENINIPYAFEEVSYELVLSGDISSLNSLSGQNNPRSLRVLGLDVVLGIQWLENLGRVAHDYNQMTMEFNWLGRVVKLSGEPDLGPQSITFSQLQDMLSSSDVKDLYKVYQLETIEAVDGVPIEKIEDVFFPINILASVMVVLQEF